MADEYEYEDAALKPRYQLPDISRIFDAPPGLPQPDGADFAQKLEDTLASFHVAAKVTHAERGPSITRYELRPDRGVRISRILARTDDIALALGVGTIRIEAPIPGKSAIGIDVVNTTASIVPIGDVLQHVPQGVPPLWMALGKDITGRLVVGDLTKMPHLLVGGAPGTGKSVCLNCIIASLLVTATPDQLELLMIDRTGVELTAYNGIPHLKNAVITDPSLAVAALAMISREMDQRYERFGKAGVRKIEEYNVKFPEERLAYIVVVIDELADLLLVAPAKAAMITERLTGLGRACGIHIVAATPLPSTAVVTGLMKANIPSRIAFAVASRGDSRAILDTNGAEELVGRGDMLYQPTDVRKPIRVQGALVNRREIEKLVQHWKRQVNPEGRTAMETTPIRQEDERRTERQVDDLWYDAAKFLLDSKVAKGEPGVGSTAALQARFSIGHPRAVRLMKQLEEFGIVGLNEGTKPRNVIIESPADLERLADRFGRPAQTDLFAG